MGWYQRRVHGDSGLNAQITMKFALVVCFAALVACEPEAKPEAEADPALLYSHYGYAGYPYAYSGKRSADAEAEPEAEANPWLAYGYGYHPYAYGGYRAYGYPYAHHGYYYGKRSADAEPKADADAYYGVYGYGLGYHGL